jgi:hypothetical protein
MGRGRPQGEEEDDNGKRKMTVGIGEGWEGEKKS